MSCQLCGMPLMGISMGNTHERCHRRQGEAAKEAARLEAEQEPIVGVRCPKCKAEAQPHIGGVGRLWCPSETCTERDLGQSHRPRRIKADARHMLGCADDCVEGHRKQDNAGGRSP